MARNHAQVLTSIWSDEDWCAVPALSQRVYLLILSQARLSLVGTVDFVPARWARRAPDTTVEDIERAVADLERRRYVVVDSRTDELLVRTFVVHDLRPARLTAPTIKGLWASWEGVDSLRLRQVIICSIPETTWEKVAESAPEAATQMRRSLPLERELESDVTRFEFPFELPPPSPSPPPSPATCLQSPSRARALAHAGGRAREEPVGAAEDDHLDVSPRLSASRQERAEAACDELGDINHDAASGEGAVRYPDAHRSACRRSARTDHLPAAQMLAHEHPDWTPSEIASSIATPAATWMPAPPLGPPAKTLYESREEMRRKRDAQAPARDPAVLTAGLAAARRAREAARAEAEANAATPEEPTP